MFSPRYKYPFYIHRFKIRWLRWIVKNYNLIKETKKNNWSKFKVKEKDFIEKVSFKLLQIQPNSKGIAYRIKNFINLFYELYWLVIWGINRYLIPKL